MPRIGIGELIVILLGSGLCFALVAGAITLGVVLVRNQRKPK